MTKNFYDAVLIGLGLPTLLAAGLLGKRGFRVLVIAHGQPLPSYELDGVTLAREPFLFTAHDSPAVTRVFHELALRPLMRRRLAPLEPPLQAVTAKHRLDFSTDGEHFAREIEREFPAVRRPADDFVRSTERAWEAINRLLERDLAWPPATFLERRAHVRASLHHPFGRDEQAPAPLSDLADDHPLRRMVDAVLTVADGGEIDDANPARRQRLFAAQLRSASLLDGGYAGLFALLIDSIRTHNGEVRFVDRVEKIHVRRGRAESVVLSPSDEEIGCHFVLSGLPVSKLARLLTDRSGLDAMLDELGQPRPRYHRFALNLIAHRHALPEGMGRSLLLLHDSGRERALPEQALWVHSSLVPGSERAVLQVEALLPALSGEVRDVTLAGLRERMLASLALLSPFLERHLLWVDSPHDGRDALDVRQGCYLAPDDPWTRGPDTMPVVYAYARTKLHGTTALPVRTPIKRLLLCSEQVVPGLGLEGLFLTASSSARVVARQLNRAWMNRGRWTKVDL